MRATVCIPWRAQPDRIAAQERVVTFWEHHGFPVILDDSCPKQDAFNISQARNNAVEQAETDVVIVADADTIPDLGAVQRAVNRIHDDLVIWPFDLYRHISAEAVQSPDLHTAPVEREYRSSVGGLFVINQRTYWGLGGQDERFESRWGYEDTCFRMAAITLANVDREVATIYSFNHAADRDLSENNPNYWRWQLYRNATHYPQMMRELLK